MFSPTRSTICLRKRSWAQPILTGQLTGLGVVNMLEPIRVAAPKARFSQASPWQMLGNVQADRQNETTTFYLFSSYVVAKLFGN